MAKVPKTPTFQLTDHICRKQHCGGRILLQVSPLSGRAGGGMDSSAYRCSGCGEESHSFNTDPLCWCGLSFKGGTNAGYQCVRTDEVLYKPWLEDALAHSGFDIHSFSLEIGAVHRDSVKLAESRYHDENSRSHNL